MLNRTRRLLVAAALATVALIGFAAAPAQAAVISSGHVDVLDVDYANGAVTLDIRTYNPANDDVSPAGNTIQLHPLSAYDLVVPSSPASWACVGTAGATVYVAPASVGSGDTRVWPGWNAEDVPAANLPVSLQLVSVSGPGRVTLYTMAGLPAQPSVVLSNSTAAGCAKSTFSITASSLHGHANWAFSAPGTYDLTFRATATGGATSGNVVYRFTIGA